MRVVTAVLQTAPWFNVGRGTRSVQRRIGSIFGILSHTVNHWPIPEN